MGYDFRDPEEQEVPGAVTHSSTMGSIMNELVKSYGFRRDETSGDWDWSLSNIGEAFKEDPFWTTIDYAALTAAPLKLGMSLKALKGGAAAVKAVEGGSTAAKVVKRADRATSIEKAYAGGEFAGSKFKPRTFSVTDRIGRAMAGEEAMSAVKKAGEGAGLSLTGLGASKVGRYFSNPLTQQFDEEYLALIDQYGGSPAELRGVVASLQREQKLAAGAVAREGSDIQREYARFEKKVGIDQAQDEKAKIGRFLDEGIKTTGKSSRRALETLSPEAQELFRKTFDYRNKIHDAAYASGLISEEVYKNNLHRWYPRLYEDFVGWQKAAADAGVNAGQVTGDAARGVGRFMPRKLTKEQANSLGRIMDPSAGIDEMIDAGQFIASQTYAQGLARSVVARDMDDILAMVGSGDEARLALHGVTAEKQVALAKLAQLRNGLNRDVLDEEIAKVLGWQRADKLFKGKGIPGYVDRMPEELLGKYIDPLVADDVVKTVKFMESPGQIRKAYQGFLGYFRASKTAYNPATHVRNLFGAAVFHHAAVGGVPMMIPKLGVRALKAGDSDEWYRAAREAGLLSETFDAEIREALEQAYSGPGAKPRGQASAMDWLSRATEKWMPGATGAARKVEGAASKAERFYRGIDEAYRLDAWIRLSKRYQKGGLSQTEARAKAMAEVHKFIPSFAQHSQFTDHIRGAIPFASFATESLRVWKNVLAEKPHLGFFWANMGDVLSEAGGAAAGLSSEDLETARQGLPHYMNNKKLMAMPFRSGGKVQFVDLSYLIPMANMVDGVKNGEIFFDQLVDPSANPVFSFAVAAKTGVDPFSGRPVEPRMTAGAVTTSNQTVRKAVGLAEHAFQSLAPPLAGGYAFQNLFELATGKRSGVTGEELEASAAKTVLANVLGLRAYEPSVNSQILNVRKEASEGSMAISQSWRRWETAKANGNVAAMEIERQRIIARKSATGADGLEYFRKAEKNHIPGKKAKVKRGLSKARVGEVQARSARLEELGMLDEDDARLLGELK